MVNNILDIAYRFNTEEECIRYLEKMRWGDEIVSPYDKYSKVYKCKGNRYKCSNTGKYFTVKTQTIFEGSKVSLRKWFLLIGMMTTHKRGISSHQVARDLGVSQPTAWLMMRKIRQCFKHTNMNHLQGYVELDEVYLSPRTRKEMVKYKGKKIKENRIISKPEFPIFTMIQENGKCLNMKVVPNTQKATLYPIIHTFVRKNSTIITDDYKSYVRLTEDKHYKYKHIIVRHSTYDFVKDGHTTNDAECAHMHLRSFMRSYNHTTVKKNLQSYIDQFVWLYNHRDDLFSDKFYSLCNLVICQVA